MPASAGLIGALETWSRQGEMLRIHNRHMDPSITRGFISTRLVSVMERIVLRR
jgi:hypothetical protein